MVTSFVEDLGRAVDRAQRDGHAADSASLQVITGLAIILTFYIMAPTGQAMYRAAEPEQFRNSEGLLNAKTIVS